MEEEKSKLEDAINKIVREDYINISLVDIDNDSFILFSSGEEVSSFPEKGIYSKEVAKFAEKALYRNDKVYYEEHMKIEAVIKALESENTEYNINYRIQTKNKKICYLTSVFTYFDEKKNTILLRNKDVTEQKIKQREEIERTKREEGRFNFLLRNICENFMEVDIASGYTILTMPKDNLVMEGYYDEQIVNFANTVVVKEEREEYIKEFEINNLIENIKKNNGLYISHCTVCYDDGIHYLLINNTIMSGAYGKEYIFLFAQDITDYKKKDEDNKHAIVEALAIAEKASKAKGEFLSRMSHEIRTPLNAIIGLTTLSKMAVNSPNKIEEYLSKIDTSSYYLLSLINDILDMSRIESGKMIIANEVFSIKALIDKINILILPQADEKNIEFSIESNIQVDMIYGDSLRLNQVLVNLLSNALKFTNPKGNILVRITENDYSDDGVSIKFSVKDTGIGIRKEKLDKIFVTFEQAENNTANRYGGTGLGLTISKSIVELMGGKLEVESEITVGSEFYFTLSFAIVPEDALELEKKQTVFVEQFDFTGKHFLLAEDNELNIEIAVELLKMVGAEVLVAKNGVEAVEMFRKSNYKYYDAILMDVQMPMKNGLEATRDIRKLSNLDATTIPIIAMSANAFEEDVEKAMNAGMDAYTSKPIDIKVVYQTINCLIDK